MDAVERNAHENARQRQPSARELLLHEHSEERIRRQSVDDDVLRVRQGLSARLLGRAVLAVLRVQRLRILALDESARQYEGFRHGPARATYGGLGARTAACP